MVGLLLTDELGFRVISYRTEKYWNQIVELNYCFFRIQATVYLLESNCIRLFIYWTLTTLNYFTEFVYSLNTDTPHTHPSDSYYT